MKNQTKWANPAFPKKNSDLGEFYEAVKFRTICGFLHYEH